MKCLEVIEQNREALESLARAGFNLRHVAYLDAVREYLARAAAGEKRTYLLVTIAARIGVSSRTLENVVAAYLARARPRRDR